MYLIEHKQFYTAADIASKAATSAIEVTPEMRIAGARILAAMYEYAGVDDKFTLDVAERIFLEMVAV
jgi:hypothetical protein